jgi:hypothetical protein
MKTVAMILGFVLILASHSIVFSETENQPSVIKKSLTCGDAEVSAESTCMYISDKIEIQCTKQTIRLINSKQGISKELPLEGKLVRPRRINKIPVLDPIVSEWTCQESTSRDHYIVLWYFCQWGKGCVGTDREWERIFTVEGSNLTKGHTRQKDTSKLRSKLGLPDEAGKLKGVVFDN